MRVLALHISAKSANDVTWLNAIAQLLLRYSPRVAVREPNWIFIDIESTAEMLGGESKVLKRVTEELSTQGWTLFAAISDTPWGAQVLATHYVQILCPLQKERMRLGELPLSSLAQYEGLTAWERLPLVEKIIEELGRLGFTTVQQLHKLSLNHWSERWGPVGETLYRRLHALERQVISPLQENTPLCAYRYLDDPVSHLPFLLNEASGVLQKLFVSLHEQRLFAQSLHLRFFCEYEKAVQEAVVEPACANRDVELFLTLLSERLQNYDFLNPVREFELELKTCPERTQQLEFADLGADLGNGVIHEGLTTYIPQGLAAHTPQLFPALAAQPNSPPNSPQPNIPQSKVKPPIVPVRGRDVSDSWLRLFSIFKQAEIDFGFLQLEQKIWPERWASLSLEPQKKFVPESDEAIKVEGALRFKPAYSQRLFFSPRPNRILSEPREMTAVELRDMKLLSRLPIERIEQPWWHKVFAGSSVGDEVASGLDRDHQFTNRPDMQATSETDDLSPRMVRVRDYFFAMWPRGERIWVFQNPETGRFYLNGYFD